MISTIDSPESAKRVTSVRMMWFDPETVQMAAP